MNEEVPELSQDQREKVEKLISMLDIVGASSNVMEKLGIPFEVFPYAINSSLAISLDAIANALNSIDQRLGELNDILHRKA